MRRITHILVLATASLFSCSDGAAPEVGSSSHSRMVQELDEIEVWSANNNFYLGDQAVQVGRTMLEQLKDRPVRNRLQLQIPHAENLLRLGKEREAIALLKEAHEAIIGDSRVSEVVRTDVAFRLGVAWMRLGETQNCCARNHEDSCLMPIQGGGVHSKIEGSTEAIKLFQHVLDTNPPESIPAIKARWIMNIAFMTLEQWPDSVPEGQLLSPESLKSDELFPRFPNVARGLGLADFDNCGGVVIDDFDGDELLDIVVSTWDTAKSLKFYRNLGDGSFEEISKQAGLSKMRGGLNLIHADYDNDGDLDLFVLRGGWWTVQGRHPNSLLQNDGHGTFVDVSFDAGVAGADYPTQTAAFADYDNDGDLDIYVGNETTPDQIAPSQLYRNRGDGTFEEVARAAGVTNDRFAKGVTWGDYDSDGFPDLYVSNHYGENRLYHNEGDGSFKDVAVQSGVSDPFMSFPTWFWDFDNDGHLDLYVASYSVMLLGTAAEYFGYEQTHAGPALYRGDGRGGFTDVATQQGLTTPSPVMGSGFGDLDNDGFLDVLLGTGDTQYETLLPNVMYRNTGGTGFSDVTVAGGFGSLQKGHGVAFADLDNDGDQDVFQQLGGGFRGDCYYNALYENPGFEGQHWVTLRLIGVESNRSALGAQIRLVISEAGTKRDIYRTLGARSSFGGNPLRQEIGLGAAESIVSLEVSWPRTGAVQTFADVEMDAFYTLTEGAEALVRRPLSAHSFSTETH